MENTPTPQPEAKPVEQKSDMKKWIIIAIVVIVALFVLRAIFAPQNIAERMIEQASNGEYDVDIDRDGSMQISGGDGEQMNITTGKSATLPDNWPSSVPLVSDANIEYSATVGDGEGGETFTVTYATSQDVSEVVDFYKEELVQNGWTIEVTMDTGDGSMLSATNDGDEGVVVNVGASDEGTTVVLSAQSSE